ncbi:MAG: hypothetical protein Q8Q18_02620 [bacterium]|nr:hypothetical protein [bacterium]
MQKIDEYVFANSAAVTGFLGSLLYYLLYLILPNVYEFLLQVSLAGGNTGGLVPAVYSFGDALQNAIMLAVLAWVLGFMFAHVYNTMTKSRGRSRK